MLRVFEPFRFVLSQPFAHCLPAAIETSRAVSAAHNTMLYAWILYGVYYIATSACTLWALTKGSGAEKLAVAICAAAGVQLFRGLPSGGLVGLPGDAVRWLNYHGILAAYRMNYL